MGLKEQSCSFPKGSLVTTPSAGLHDRAFLDPTCFLRCAACLGIVVLHVLWFVGLAADDKHAIDTALAQHTWITVVFNAEPHMQSFMCLTGYDWNQGFKSMGRWYYKRIVLRYDGHSAGQGLHGGRN